MKKEKAEIDFYKLFLLKTIDLKKLKEIIDKKP
jgi:hypothetical protein